MELLLLFEINEQIASKYYRLADKKMNKKERIDKILCYRSTVDD